MPETFLFVDKPAGISSHRVVQEIRRATGIQRVGHAGTLDPFATGLLIVGVGRESTKHLNRFLKQDKVYTGVIRLGGVSSTDDLQGEITEQKCTAPSLESVTRMIASFVGEQQQLPPKYSAIKIKGKKAYELMVEGKEPDLKPRTIIVYSFKVLSYKFPLVEFEVKVSSGSYIRALARDIGQKFGCGGYLEVLKRTAIGDISIEQARTLSDIIKAYGKS